MIVAAVFPVYAVLFPVCTVVYVYNGDSHFLSVIWQHYHQVISAVQNVFLTLCCHDRCAGDEMMVDAAITFIDILVLRLVDLNWEVRDTTLTVIDKLLSALPTSGRIEYIYI